ncbi:glycoside hydrolase family 43 protein [Pontibacter sp. G13]|uniref:glycoside hydrolase family 43 protein n=1 Tax=Pontibacter sp. G13 TaxID=3074898 RepID=UPI00288A6BBD|nr:glycoside hydrolase family 43 protein [Pontibacter sp. G13]WNJ16172.1 glycoside hydrolase family 43 protein [Pontibacter sp. G13]
MSIQNPILPGFHPDPSIIRVGDDFYMATSTFEWYPGLQLFHSTDLANWELIGHPLTRLSQLDMRGMPDSCGVWAPCLSYDKGTYYMVYCNVRSFDGPWKDTPNFMVTAPDISGPWSDPIFLGSSGFDGSLFHDEDGRKWYVTMEVDHRGGKFFGGILLQEYDPQAEALVGPVYPIFEGTELGKTEGPHIYQKDGYYYLLTAEGGTEYGHAVSIARSKSITGPYEVHPEGPLMTCRDVPHNPLQKSGHGDLVQDLQGDWWLVSLVGRPLSTLGRCPLGRETAIERVVWEAGAWPTLAHEGAFTRLEIPAVASNAPRGQIAEHVDFAEDELPMTYNSLRHPIAPDWCKVEDGTMKLVGRDSLSSTFEQSLVARRVQHTGFSYEIELEFSPESFQQMAGLVCYYNTAHYYYLHIMGDEDGTSRFVNLIRTDNYRFEECLPALVPLPASGVIKLKVVWDRAQLSFFYAVAGGEWICLSTGWDSSILSDDYVRDGSDRYRPAFTGAFVGMACQDLTGNRKAAHFQRASYVEDGSLHPMEEALQSFNQASY